MWIVSQTISKIVSILFKAKQNEEGKESEPKDGSGGRGNNSGDGNVD